jgi:hypothetical protein
MRFTKAKYKRVSFYRNLCNEKGLTQQWIEPGIQAMRLEA